ncbi:unnamed protein product [Calypogeia fissa]
MGVYGEPPLHLSTERDLLLCDGVKSDRVEDSPGGQVVVSNTRISYDRTGYGYGGGGGWEDWANISSEILVLVIKKVQERAEQDNDEMRRIVAMAGVCRSWRLAIQTLLAANPFSSSSLLQFPTSLREAGPLDKPMQCVLRRRGGQFFLYQSDCGSGQELREGKSNFLMGACKRWRPGHMMFMLSSDRNNRAFSHKSVGFMGKLRSNFWGTAFVLWDFQSSGSGGTNGVNNNDKARPVTFVRFTEEVVDGVRKRKMTCVVRAPRMSRVSSMTSHQHHGMNGCFPPVLTAKSLWKWSCMSSLNKTFRSTAHGGRPRGGYLSLKEEIMKTKMEERVLDQKLVDLSSSDMDQGQQIQSKVKLRGVPGMLKKGGQKVAMFTGTIPEWDVQRRCWSLDFKGRATLPSMHNFQLLMPAGLDENKRKKPRGTSLERNGNDHHHPAQQQQTVVMQVGKIGKGLYALEFRYPLSALQAFNIALSSFATTVGVES